MGFKDALKNYKANTSPAPAAPAAPAADASAAASAPTTVPVNPPEAVKVLEEQTLPETEGKQEPKAEEPAPKARAPRGSKKQAEQPAAPAGSEVTSAGDPATAGSADLAGHVLAVSKALPKGCSITIRSVLGD